MSTPADSTGTVIGGRYRLEERIGAGGMGEVYRARDLTLRRTVALKLMRPALQGKESSKRRFLREARAAAALDHPGIAPTHDAGETEDGVRYIAIAYYEGESLAARLARSRLSPARAIEIALRLAEALAYAHDRGVVHRDLKPANVLLTAEGEIKLIDFGVAKQAGSTALTQDGAVLGTPAYMAPEQVTGGPTDERTDLWALGVVLFEMLTGERAFGAEESQGVLYAILHSEAPEPTLKGPGAAELKRILGRALAKAPRERYASADELVADLQPLAGLLPGTVRTLTYPTTSRRATTRPKRVLWSAAAVAMGAVLIAVWFLRPESPVPVPVAGPGAAVAVLPFENLTGDEQLSYVGSGLAAGLISQLSGLPGVTVVGRTRTWSAQQALGSSQALAEQLGVNALVEGEVHREGGRLRVDVATSDAASAVVLWSDSFPGAPDELYALQQTIARALARVLSVQLSAADRRRLARGGPSAEAFYRYLLGLERLEQPGNPRHAQFAADHFREAIRIEPDFALFHAALSQAIYRQHLDGVDSADLAEAEREARRALELDPGLADAHVALARALRGQGRDADSIAQLRPLLASHPKPDEAFRELAYSYAQTGDQEAAAEAFQSAVALGSENWFNWNALGAFQAEQGNLAGAQASLEQAAELAPASVFWPRLNLGGLKLLQRDYAGAIEQFEATGSTTSDPELASNMASAYYFQGRVEDAERLYRLAVTLEPGSHRLHRNLGDALLRLNREQEALAEFREALRLVEQDLVNQPRSNALLRSRPLYVAKAGDCDSAVAHAEAARPLLPANWQNHLNLAMTFALCGRRADALRAVEVCLESGLPGPILRDQDELRALFGDPEFVRLTGG